MKKLIILLIVLGLAGSASALTVSVNTTWDSEYTFDSSGVTVTSGATLTVTARVNQDYGYLTVETGCSVQANTPQWCFPDGDAHGIAIVLMDGATVSIDDFNDKNVGEAGMDGIFVGNGAVITRNGSWSSYESHGIIYTTDTATGYTISPDGSTITGTPEPATIALLGLGSLALLRRRR